MIKSWIDVDLEYMQNLKNGKNVNNVSMQQEEQRTGNWCYHQLHCVAILMATSFAMSLVTIAVVGTV